MTVGERIRQTRIEKELSQAELAERAHYSDKTRISKIENAGNDISMKQVRRLANALDVSATYLMGWEDRERGIAVTEPSVGYPVQLPSYDYNVDEKAAIELYEQYKNLSPEKQAAFQNYLKFLQSES